MLESSTLKGGPKTRQKSGWTSEHYNALIRRLQTAGKGWTDTVPRAIGVTSCGRGQGVTTIAANMAIAAAKLSSGPVLLVDANAQEPAIGHTFRAKSRRGLLNALTGEQAVFDCLIESPIANMSLLLPGELKKNQHVSHSPPHLDELLDNLKHVFHMIVFDLPPAHPLTTCYSFAARLDGILLVIESEKVHRDVALRVRKQLVEIQADVLGVVVNKHCRRFGDRSGRLN